MSYDIPRQRTWGWKVSSYIWTKSIAAGAAVVPAILHLLGMDHESMFARIAPHLALAFLALTGVLLVADLKRPERFWTILLRPQWRSWLARGAYVITAYGLVLFFWAMASIHGNTGLLDILAVPVIALGTLTAVYTAWLFGQCEGRDLWQSRWLLPHLLAHAVVAGLVTLLLAGSLAGASGEQSVDLAPWAAGGLVLTALLALADAYGAHRTANAAAAAHALVRGHQASLFWIALAGGMLLPALLLLLGSSMPLLVPVAATLALAGLWLQGHALVLAGQGPPIS